MIKIGLLQLHLSYQHKQKLSLQITDHTLVDPQEKGPEIRESSVAAAFMLEPSRCCG